MISISCVNFLFPITCAKQTESRNMIKHRINTVLSHGFSMIKLIHMYPKFTIACLKLNNA